MRRYIDDTAPTIHRIHKDFLVGDGILKKAKTKHYQAWLKGYLSSGKVPTEFHESHFKEGGFLIAKSHFRIFPLYDKNAVNIIIPEGIHFLGTNGDLGHSKLYFMEGFCKKGNSVPVFNNIKFKEKNLQHILEESKCKNKGMDRTIQILTESPRYLFREEVLRYRYILTNYDSIKIGKLSEEEWEKTKRFFYKDARYWSDSNPQDFINWFSNASEKSKKSILRIMFEDSFENKEVIDWVNKHESKLIKEVGSALI